jgi:hypothetical protein
MYVQIGLDHESGDQLGTSGENTWDKKSHATVPLNLIFWQHRVCAVPYLWLIRNWLEENKAACEISKVDKF